MTDYTFNLSGRIAVEAWISITRGTETATAFGLAFDSDADVLAETDSTRYSGYCDSEIAYHEVHRLLASRWGIESEDIAAAVDAQLPVCECD